MSERKNIFSSTGLFTPSIVRTSTRPGGSVITRNANDADGIQLDNTSSFKFDPLGSPLKSTQQLPIEWSEFENHTFFNSAESKVNVAFDTIINYYPFDGTKLQQEIFNDQLSGYEKYIYDVIFPKNIGWLHFSGSSGTSGGTFIKTVDVAGSLFPEISNDQTGKSILEPGSGSLTVESFIYVHSSSAFDNQIIAQKLDSTTQSGFTLALSGSTPKLVFMLSSDGATAIASSSLTTGSWQHIAAVLPKATGSKALKLYVNGNLQSESADLLDYQAFNFKNSSLFIGSGSSHDTREAYLEDAPVGAAFIPQQTLTASLDEFRIWHSERSVNQLKTYSTQSIYADPNLKLLYKFNEPTGSYTNNDVALDSSGNSLHAAISNFSLTLRSSSLGFNTDHFKLEKPSENPVLFPDFPTLTGSNTRLLSSASDYDNNNPNIITNLIPAHYLQEGQTEEGLSTVDGGTGDAYSFNEGVPGGGKIGAPQIISAFLFTWAKQFDQVKLYIDNLSKFLKSDYNDTDGFAEQLLPYVLKYYGLETPVFNNLASIEQDTAAANLNVDVGLSDDSLRKVQTNLIRRLIKNLPEVVSSKGTTHSIKSFMRSVGVNPDSNFRFREFGGARKLSIEDARAQRFETSAMLDMSGAVAPVTPTLDKQGIPDNLPFLQSSYLSGSRTEVGVPAAVGTFVNKTIFPPHGISDNEDDGLWTSGSFTFEGSYQYKMLASGTHPVTQSIMRLHSTGTSGVSHNVLFNVLAFSGSVSENTTGSLRLYGRTLVQSTAPLIQLNLTGVDIFDGNVWNVSFGRERADLIGNDVSSSYFLRAGNQSFGKLVNYYHTSSLYDESIKADNILSNRGSDNTSGSFITLGSQSIDTSFNFYLNDSSVDIEARHTNFTGRAGHFRMFSQALSLNEHREHVRNFKSLGVFNPHINFNFIDSMTGSFEKLRLDVSTDQITTQSNTSGIIVLTDFAQSTPGSGTVSFMSGTGFEASKRIIKPEDFNYSILDPKFDERSDFNKIRIRSFEQQSNVDNFGGSLAPKYQILNDEQSQDDTRFSIEASMVQALNEDIINMFSTLDEIEVAIGQPGLQFAVTYPDLRHFREVYFNRLSDKLNFQAFFEFFKWFTSNYESFVSRLVPSKTNFLGINFVVESHMLERHKLPNKNYNMYVKVEDRDFSVVDITNTYFDTFPD